MKLATFIAGSLLLSPLLYSKNLTVQGVWNGGGKEVYTKGNAQYCIRPNAGSAVTFNLTTQNAIYSTIYLTYGNVIAQGRWINPYLKVKHLQNKTYKVILAPDTPQVDSNFSLNVKYFGTFGKCADYYQAGFLGMSIQDVNFILSLAGLVTGIVLFGSLTYIILTLGNF